MPTSDSKIADYYRKNLGFLSVLSLQISQVPSELGDHSQSVHLELLRTEPLRKVTIRFSAVVQLKIADLHPGTKCLLQIESTADAQMENIRYRIFNGEQDLTLSFYCLDFEVVEREL